MRHEAPPATENRLAGATLVDRELSVEIVPSEAHGFTPEETVFPAGSRVFLTHIAGKPLAAQVDAARRLAARGYRPVPHLGARNFGSVEEYAVHLEALGAVGVEEALFVGGNPAKPAGTLNEASDLLAHPVVEDAGIRVACLAAHPEGHPVAAADVVDEAMRRKLELCRARGLAPVVVSQFGFDGGVMAGWAERFAAEHPDVPLRIGLAGVTSLRKLIGYARRCGVGPSIAAITGGPGRLLGLVGERDPGDIVDAIDRTGIAARPNVALHFFTFGNWQRTLDWVALRRGG